jgi:tRNA 2-thiouridine synthesizing protein A
VSDSVVIDARGHRCPVPSLKLMKAMETAPPGARIVLLATDPMARIDVPFLMSQKGGRVIEVEDGDGLLRFTIETGAQPDAPTD